MAITIVATVGAASANSYVTEAECITYMSERLNASAWTTTSGATLTETEKKALREACRDLENLAWLGNRTDSTQALAWPREWVVNPEDPDGDYYDDNVVPQRVKDAQCELAFQYIKAGSTDVAALDSLHGIESKTIDVITTRYTPHSRPAGVARYPRVYSLVAPLLTVAGVTARIVRG